MAIKKKPEEHENHERWLISYADFITLLFAFFVVMYSSSSRDLANIKKLEVSLMKSFGSHSSGPMEKQDGKPFADRDAQSFAPLENRFSYGPGEGHDAELSPEDIYNKESALYRLKTRVDGIIRANGSQASLQTKLDAKGLLITLTEDRIFTKSGEIRSDRQKLLLDIAKELRTMDRTISIEGTAVRTSQRSLTAAMQTAGAYTGEILRFLKDDGRIAESKLRASTSSQSNVGFSRPEDLDDGIAIDIVVTREKADE